MAKVEAMIHDTRQSGRTILTETESKQVLAAYDIPTIPMYIAPTVEEAVTAADKVGYPVVLKLNSETITHKSDVGGVKLNLNNADAVRTAFDEIYKSVSEKASAADFHGCLRPTDD